MSRNWFNGKDIDGDTGRDESVIRWSLRVVKAIEDEELAVPCSQIGILKWVGWVVDLSAEQGVGFG